MASRLINKYVWIVDTILRHRRITRQELNELWIAAKDISDGCEMPRRTFFNYCKVAALDEIPAYYRHRSTPLLSLF